ncbi:hypothetical protein EST38_g14219, partial [Candolleomyces aberdarensis]
PGRFFAVNEVKAMMAHILLNYDIKLPGDSKEIPRGKYFAGARTPAPNAEIMFRKRKLFFSTCFVGIIASNYERVSLYVANLKAALRKGVLLQAAEDSALVQAMHERFNVEGTSSSSEAANPDSEKPVQVILSRLDSIVARLEATERLVGAEKTQFPISILTLRESNDADSTELSTLDLMKRTGLALPEAALTSVLQLYTRVGDSAAADRFVEAFLTSPATEDQRHFHIQAHLKATPKDLLPTSALDLIHS